MVIVEFLDREPLENVVSILANRPEKMILVGASSELEAYLPAVQRFAQRVSPETEIVTQPIVKTKLSKIVKVLSRIAQENPGCSFDLGGGDDLAMVAMGIVFERFRKEGIQLHQYNLRTGKVYDCDGDKEFPSADIPPLSVEETIILHGGCVVKAEEKPGGTMPWIWDEEFARDVEKMWAINAADCGKWNAQISTLSHMLEYVPAQEDPLQLSVPVPEFRRWLDRREFYLDLKGIFPRLQRAGLISELVNEGDVFSLRFKNEQVKRALAKAGTILELKTAMVARGMQGENGPAFSDVQTGVFIDWDGVVHDSQEYLVDTENEIDVILMEGVLPVFISCKNGSVGEEELYKLHTVATRFGGKYVRKLLVATTFGKGAKGMQYFRERADDMHIHIVEGVQNMDDASFAEALREALR